MKKCVDKSCCSSTTDGDTGKWYWMICPQCMYILAQHVHFPKQHKIKAKKKNKKKSKKKFSSVLVKQANKLMKDLSSS